jgi:hypothetical protein
MFLLLTLVLSVSATENVECSSKIDVKYNPADPLQILTYSATTKINYPITPGTDHWKINAALIIYNYARVIDHIWNEDEFNKMEATCIGEYKRIPPDTYYLNSSGAYIEYDATGTELMWHGASDKLVITIYPTSSTSLAQNNLTRNLKTDKIKKFEQYGQQLAEQIAAKHRINLNEYSKIDVFEDKTIQNRMDLVNYFVSLPQIGDCIPAIYLKKNNINQGIIMYQTKDVVNKLYFIENINSHWMIKSVRIAKGTAISLNE